MKIFIVLTAIAVLSSCDRRSVAYSVAGYGYRIDTINIHGVYHEFLIQSNNQYFNGFTHSPECPCLKKKGE